MSLRDGTLDDSGWPYLGDGKTLVSKSCVKEMMEGTVKPNSGLPGAGCGKNNCYWKEQAGLPDDNPEDGWDWSMSQPFDEVVRGDGCHSGPMYDAHFGTHIDFDIVVCGDTNFKEYPDPYGNPTHPCASVGDMYQNKNFRLDEKSSAIATEGLNAGLVEDKTDFLVPYISAVRGAYFMAGAIVGAWAGYLGAKSKALSEVTYFRSSFPASIPKIPTLGGPGPAIT